MRLLQRDVEPGLTQIDDVALKTPGILRTASIKNRSVPINRIPPETLTLTATFLPNQRDVINATAVCQQWRMTLLSFPQVWRNVGGKSLLELETYLERSKSIPIGVELFVPSWAASIIPHTSRLEDLTVWVDDSIGFEEITQHLCGPIPTLHSLEIRSENIVLCTLQLPPGLCEGLFRHLKTLHLYGISALGGSQTFPHITKLAMCTGSSNFLPFIDLLNMLRQLPGLVEVSMRFQGGWYGEIPQVEPVTLPYLREIRLSTPDPTKSTSAMAIPCVLRVLGLPMATSLTVESSFYPTSNYSILPLASFNTLLPNYVELPELHVETKRRSGKIAFRSSSQAVFTYHTRLTKNHLRELRLWGGLPISSVRKVTAIQLNLRQEDVWLVGLLGQLEFLEVLELGGDCGHVLRRLRHRMARGVISTRIDTLIVRGGEYAKSQALKFEGAVNATGFGNTTVTYIPDISAHEKFSEFESEDEDDLGSGGDNYSGEGDDSDSEDDSGGGDGDEGRDEGEQVEE